MVKTQIQIPEEDLSSLRRMASEQGTTVSELIRRGVKQILVAEQQIVGKKPTEEQWQKIKELAGAFDSGLSDVSEHHADYFAEAIEDDNLR